MKFTFDATNIGNTIDAGTVSFEVKETIPADSYVAILKKSLDDGLTYSEVVEQKGFELGNKVDFDISDFSSKATEFTYIATDHATFDVEDGDKVDKSASFQIGVAEGQNSFT